jgi:hypothetical protein
MRGRRTVAGLVLRAVVVAAVYVVVAEVPGQLAPSGDNIGHRAPGDDARRLTGHSDAGSTLKV